MLIFLIFVVLVVSVMIWRMRKTQAEIELAKHESVERRKKQEKEALTPQEDITWPVIIRPVSGNAASVKASDPEHPEEETFVEEPSMTSIEFVPVERV